MTTRFKRWLIVVVLLTLVFDTVFIRVVDARTPTRTSCTNSGDPVQVFMPPEAMMSSGLLVGPMGGVCLR